MILLFRYQNKSNDTEPLLPALPLIYCMACNKSFWPSLLNLLHLLSGETAIFFFGDQPSDPANHMSNKTSPK